MSAELLIRLAAVYALGFAVFHVLFARIFEWPASLAGSGPLNTSITRTLNGFLAAVFLLVAIVLWRNAPEIAVSRLGRELMLGLSLLLAFRVTQQVRHFPLSHPRSLTLLIIFVLGVALFAAPAVLDVLPGDMQ